MIRVVLDTNIIVSALLQPFGAPAQIFLLALERHVQLCISGAIYAEYEEVIRRPRLRLEDRTILDTLQAMRVKSVWVKPSETLQVCSDPDDDIFLECAKAAHADYIVTGNLKHFPALWNTAKIVSARTFLDSILSSENRKSPG